MGRKPKEINTIPGERLKKLLSEHGVFIKDFAESANCTPVQMSRYLNGVNELPEDVIQLALGQFPAIRHEYLQGIDPFPTEAERIASNIVRRIKATVDIDNAVITIAQALKYELSEDDPEFERIKNELLTIASYEFGKILKRRSN